MSDLDIVTVAPEEAEAFVRSLTTTFLDDPHDEAVVHRAQDWRLSWDQSRTWGVRDRSRWVATLATQPRTITVPGSGSTTRDLATDALTAVTVAATHRRQGLLTRMLGGSLAAAAARGDALSILVAAEWPIYGRFGYAPAVDVARHRLRTRATGGLLAAGAGRVRQLERVEVGELAPAVFDAARRLRAGQVDRPGPWWPSNLGLEPYHLTKDARLTWVVHEGPDGADGLVAWRTTRNFDLTGPKGAVDVPHLIASTEDAYLGLWGYLAGLDGVEEVVADLRPIDEPLRWVLGDARALEQIDRVDHVWVRLLDVRAALRARRYAVPGRVVIEVGDPHGASPAAGRYALESAADESTCEVTSAEPDVEIPQRTLASIYLGGHRLGQFGRSAGVREHSTGAVDLLDRMFATALPPWNQTGF